MINNISKLKDWQIKKLPEVVFFQEGPGVRNNQYTQTGVKLLNVANLVEGQVVLENTNRYISEEEAYGKYNHFLVDEGDLIIASSGIKVEYFDKKMGFVKKEHLPLCMNTSTIRFKSLDNGNLNLKYFSYFLKSIYFKKQIARLITGSAQLNFGPSHLKQIDVIVPPINIQNNIVNILDKSKYLIDKRKEQIESLDELVKSKFIDMFGSPATNPKGWKVTTIGNITTDVRYGTSKPAVEGGKYPYLRMNNITYNGYLDLDNLKYIDIEDDELEKCIVRKGDVLFNRTNSAELIGKTCVFDLEEPMIIAGYIIRVRLINEVLPIYLSMFLNSDFGKELLRGMAKGAVNQANINAQELKSIKIAIPPIEFQNQFADFVKQVDKLKFEMEKSLKELEDNFNSLMQKAFKGELFD